MEWRRHGEDNQNGQIVTADKVEESENFHVISTIIIIFNSSINGSFFSCKIYFSTQKPRLHANASNTPDFNYVWKSPKVKQLGYDSAFIAKPKTTHGYNDRDTNSKFQQAMQIDNDDLTSVFTDRELRFVSLHDVVNCCVVRSLFLLYSKVQVILCFL